MQPKIISKDNVYEAAKRRIRYLFNEFEEIVIGFSGGKDSTVIFHLALEVAKELNRLPLTVFWIDQEGEWQGTVDFVTEIMERDDVNPLWLQIPFFIENSASTSERFVHCWNPELEGKWIHDKHKLSIKENIYGIKTFYEIFPAVMNYHYKGKKVCFISGVRTQESPKRYVALTNGITYKWITWGKKLNKNKNHPEEHYTFYPIYDWGIIDVWKYIHDNNISYNKIYDKMYQKKVPIKDMRISNIHHETAIQSLLLIQEIEPDTWNKVVSRIQGGNTIKHLTKNAFSCPIKLPYMFKDWKEYAEHLIENLVPDTIEELKPKKIFYNVINTYKDIFTENRPNKIYYIFYRTLINSILKGDWELVVMRDFTMRPDVRCLTQYCKGRYNQEQINAWKFLTDDEKIDLLNKLKELNI